MRRPSPGNESAPRVRSWATSEAPFGTRWRLPLWFRSCRPVGLPRARGLLRELRSSGSLPARYGSTLPRARALRRASRHPGLGGLPREVLVGLERRVGGLGRARVDVVVEQRLRFDCSMRMTATLGPRRTVVGPLILHRIGDMLSVIPAPASTIPSLSAALLQVPLAESICD